MATKLKALLRMAGCALVVAAVGAGANAAEPLPPLTAGSQLGAGWAVVGLPQQALPLTRFSVRQVDGRSAVQLDADASYGNLVHGLDGVAAPQRLRWAWRLQQPNAATDLHRKAGDDVAAKVCLSFGLPLERLGFIERQKLRMARDISGQPLPAETLCWVWGRNEAVGASIANPFSGRLRYLVLRNAQSPLATWLDEDRDIRADFLRAFGDETTVVPPLVAVGIGADADNTRQRSVAQVADLRFAD